MPLPLPLPRNPVDGQTVSALASDGSLLTATYRAAKNEWSISRQPPPVTLPIGPQQVAVTPTVDQQTVVWDATAQRWVASSIVLKLTQLQDVDQHSTPTLGNMPIWSYAKGHPETGKFQWATPPAHLKNWDSVVHWESGAAVYHHGQLWRATRDNVNVEPRVEDGRTQLYLHVAGEPTFGILPTDITSTPPPSGLQPMQFKLGYWLQYTDDHHLTVWKWVLKGADPSTHRPIGEWEGRPWTCMVWRSPNPPSGAVPPGTVVVWIRSEPGSTVQPIKGQQDWASLELAAYLSQNSDVSAATPANNDVLLYSVTTHKWTATTLTGLANLLKPLLTQTTP